MPLEFAGAAVGLWIVYAATALPVVAGGAVITGFSTGLLLPTLLVWAVNRLGDRADRHEPGERAARS